jgi:peptidoglycan/LPS O-acetylase OafA/YrhL
MRNARVGLGIRKERGRLSNVQDTDTYGPDEAGRRPYLDGLRVAMIAIVFGVHTGMPFNSASSWAVMNEETAFLPAGIAGYFYQWVMQVFFLVAGASAGLSLRRHNARQYLIARALRLGVPYIVGVLFLSPVHDYFSALNRGRFDGSFLAFVREFFGRAEWGWLLALDLPDNHLWFLRYLFAYSVVALPVFLWMRTPGGERFTRSCVRVLGRPGGVFLLAAPVAVVQGGLRPAFHAHGDWSDVVMWFLFFLFGYVFVAGRLEDAVRRAGPWGAAMGVFCMAVTAWLYRGGYVEEWELNPAHSAGAVLYEALRSLNTCGWAVFWTWAGMRVFERGGAWLAGANEGILPFYVLHQPVIVAAGYFVLQWNLAILPKWCALFTISLAATLGLYVFLVRPFRPARLAFGMRPPPRGGAAAGRG